MKIKTHSDIETKNFAEKIAKKYKNQGGIIALIGELGAGKTTFAQGFAKGLGIKEKVISPTFVLIRQHHLPNSKRILFHIDLYRLENINIQDLGIKEILESVKKGKNIILIEWAEKIKDQLPEEILILDFKRLDNNIRKVIITKPKPKNSKN